MPEIMILYDGWPLVREPGSPAALHLLTLLAYHPDGMQACLALPGPVGFPLPEAIQPILLPAGEKPRDRLIWEQRRLPALARSQRADLVHLTSGVPALFGRAMNVLSPANYEEEVPPPGQGPAGRLRRGLASGAQVRLRYVFWPSDLPPLGEIQAPIQNLPPVVHPIFLAEDKPGEPGDPTAELNLSEGYILYHGPLTRPALHRLLSAWSWAGGSIGLEFPLVLPGLPEPTRRLVEALTAEYQLADTVRLLPVVDLGTLAHLYRNCTALFHPAGVPPWGDPLRNALACARPVVALQDEQTDALVGPAAYLVADQPDQNTARALGAALITVVVEGSVAERLAESARKRAAAWHAADFGAALQRAYQAAAALHG